MGLRFRKSFKAGPFRVTASKSGVSTSFGGKGARITKTASGKTRTTISVPGTGLSYVSESGKKKRKVKSYSPEYLAAVALAEEEMRQKETTPVLAKKPKAPKGPPPSVSAVRRVGVLIILFGVLFSLLFLPVGLAVLAYGVYYTVKAPATFEKMCALYDSDLAKYQAALAEWEANNELEPE
jgi:hypothetical protein